MVEQGEDFLGTQRATPSTERVRGVVLTPAEIQFEGMDCVLDRINRTGANAVAISPGVFLPGSSETGVREPPVDVDGEVRELDRPLWGSRVAYVRRFSPYAPDPQIWQNVPFKAPTLAPEGYRVDVARQLIDAARQRELAAYLILSPTVLPGLPGGHSMSGGIAGGDMDERPLPISGTRSKRIIAGQGCPNNEQVRALVVARVREAVKHYGDAAGFFFDWLEYTCYFLEDAFTCVCPSCRAAAVRAGIEWEPLTQAVRDLWNRLHVLTNDDLRLIVETGTLSVLLSEAQAERVAGFWQFKARSVASLLQLIAETVRASGSPQLSIGANGFPPPWSKITGAKFGAAAPYVNCVRPKFFTFHWAMMVRWYGEAVRAWNPDLDERLIVAALLALFGMHPPHEEHRQRLSDYGMPKPTEPHPLTAADIRRKLEQVNAQVAGTARVEAYVHSYQPVKTFNELMVAMEDTEIDGVWVQRYGYLSDEKLEVLTDRWRTHARAVPAMRRASHDADGMGDTPGRG